MITLMLSRCLELVNIGQIILTIALLRRPCVVDDGCTLMLKLLTPRDGVAKTRNWDQQILGPNERFSGGVRKELFIDIKFLFLIVM